jgi:hypothetical protein
MWPAPKTTPPVPQNTTSHKFKRDLVKLLQSDFYRKGTLVRRREIPHFALHRINFIPFFHGASAIFLRPCKIPL